MLAAVFIILLFTVSTGSVTRVLLEAEVLVKAVKLQCVCVVVGSNVAPWRALTELSPDCVSPSSSVISYHLL